MYKNTHTITRTHMGEHAYTHVRVHMAIQIYVHIHKRTHRHLKEITACTHDYTQKLHTIHAHM